MIVMMLVWISDDDSKNDNGEVGSHDDYYNDVDIVDCSIDVDDGYNKHSTSTNISLLNLFSRCYIKYSENFV